MEGTKNKIWTIVIAALTGISIGHAAPPAKKGAPAAPDANKGFRKKELNFEERVIEGLSNRGYESLSQTGSNDGLKGEKLYRKRAEFDEDSKSLLREMEYLK
jgi:hypothetical protein